jgi:hypothetical protein
MSRASHTTAIMTIVRDGVDRDLSIGGLVYPPEPDVGFMSACGECDTAVDSDGKEWIHELTQAECERADEKLREAWENGR